MDAKPNYLQNTIFAGDIVYNKNNEDPAHFILRLKSLKKALSNDDPTRSSRISIYESSEKSNTFEKKALENVSENEKNVQLSLKQKQFDIIQDTNPMWDDYHVGIRSAEDIRTWEEVLELNDENEGQFVWGDFSRDDAMQALEDNSITVYSSYPIKNGTFVSTSYIQAREYAGGSSSSKVYSKTVPQNYLFNKNSSVCIVKNVDKCYNSSI